MDSGGGRWQGSGVGRGLSPPENGARFCARANEKVRPHFLGLPGGLPHGQAGRARASWNSLPTLYRSCLLESWLHRAVCFGQMHDMVTVVRQRRGWGGWQRLGYRGPCAFSTERKVFFTGGVRPQAASRSQL